MSSTHTDDHSPSAHSPSAQANSSAHSSSHVLVIDDEPSIREVLEIFFEQRGCDVTLCADAEEASRALTSERFSLIITDLRLPKGGGMHVLDVAKRTQPSCPVVMMTAYASTSTAIEAMKRGAYDYLPKPFDLDALDLITQKALTHSALLDENARLKARLEEQPSAERLGLIGQSAPMRSLFKLIERVAPSKTPVLILGESGTGKEVVAQAIHKLSPRASAPFVVINCAAVPEHLFESELFGHVRGAFTGAVEHKTGLFQAAHRGTLFLDEIGEMPLSMQAKVLRAIQFQRVKAVGATKEEPLDIRILAATNRSLKDEVTQGSFREDLYYRLNVIPLELPPLRERVSDIPLLVEYFIEQLSADLGREPPRVDPSLISALLNSPLPGNIRELKNLCERALALSEGGLLTAKDVMIEAHLSPAPLKDTLAVSQHTEGAGAQGASTQDVSESQLASHGHSASRHSRAYELRSNTLEAQMSLEELYDEVARHVSQEAQLKGESWRLDEQLAHLEGALLRHALAQTGGHRTEAARLLGVTFRSLRYRLQKLEPVSSDEVDEHTPPDQ